MAKDIFITYMMLNLILKIREVLQYDMIVELLNFSNGHIELKS